MKTTEEKAQAYDKALEIAKEVIKTYQSRKVDDILFYAKADLQEIFPELKEEESEDEKIKKWIITQLKIKIGDNATLNNMIYKALAWLERKKDYVSTEMVEDSYPRVCTDTEKQDNSVTLPIAVYRSLKSANMFDLVNEFANKYSHHIWEKLMDNFKNNENYHIGCNDVSDIVLNAIINTYNWLDTKISEEEQKTDDKIGPKFKVGDTIQCKDLPRDKYTIKEVHETTYILDNGKPLSISGADVYWELVEQKSDEYCEDDSKIREELISFLNSYDPFLTRKFTIWLEKQGDNSKLSEEEQNQFANSVLTGCAESFINYLDAHKDENKMCVSNGECEDIENAFQNAMWDILHRYYCKYIYNTEKKSEQKPKGKSALEAIKEEKVDNANKIEPKFKVGDWIVYSDSRYKQSPRQILKINNANGCYETTDGFIHFDFESFYRLWTIEDAEEGEVLTFKNNITGTIICKSPTNYITRSYCRLTGDYFIDEEEIGWDSTLLCPAIKEQRDALFAIMKKEGYEWDAENLELKKIESNKQQNYNGLSEFEKAIQRGFICAGVDNVPVPIIRETADDCLNKLKWNEIDSSHIESILTILRREEHKALVKQYKDVISSNIHWLKSLQENQFFHKKELLEI